jgi:hypothetical protein
MELSVMKKEEKKHDAIDNLTEELWKGTAHRSIRGEAGDQATLCRFDPNVRITEAMKWHPPERPTIRKPHNWSPYTGPTWGHLFRQIIVGVIEILIPLAFIVGMIYWRAPWLFWAVVHFLRGEPIFHF